MPCGCIRPTVTCSSPLPTPACGLPRGQRRVEEPATGFGSENLLCPAPVAGRGPASRLSTDSPRANARAARFWIRRRSTPQNAKRRLPRQAGKQVNSQAEKRTHKEKESAPLTGGRRNASPPVHPTTGAVPYGHELNSLQSTATSRSISPGCCRAKTKGGPLLQAEAAERGLGAMVPARTAIPSWSSSRPTSSVRFLQHEREHADLLAGRADQPQALDAE